MNHCELRELIDCVLCGSDVSLGQDRAYAITTSAALCFSCAVCRGGIYDEGRHTWIQLPDLIGLPSHDYSHAHGAAPKRYSVQRTPVPPAPSGDLA